MKSLATLVLSLMTSGCYAHLGTVVTDVKYDDSGRLMVTRCELGALQLGWSFAPQIDESSCRFERPAARVSP